MGVDEWKEVIVEALMDYETMAKPKKEMEFSKKLILGTLVFIGLICIFSILSWFFVDDWPREIVEFFVWPFIVGVTGYMGKSAYENKAKINGRKDGGV